MDKLPDSVLVKVLSKCKSKHLRLVSPHWKDVIDKYQGILVVKGVSPSRISILEPEDCFSHLTICTTYAKCILGLINFSKKSEISANDSQEPSVDVEPIGLKGTSENEVLKTVSELPTMLTKDDITPEQIKSPNIEAPERINKLSFIGLIPFNISCEMISKCSNLTSLHIHISTFAGIDISSTLSLDIPKLKALVINSAGIKEAAIRNKRNPTRFLNFRNIYKLLSSFLNTNLFPQLDTLSLDLPYCVEKEGLLVSSITEFLFKHRDSIHSFTYLQNFMINLNENHNEAQDVSIRSLAQCAMQLKKVQLKNLHIHLLTQQDSGPLWKNFLLHEKQMEKLIFTGSSRIPFPSNTLTDNGSTLTTLILEVRDDVDLKCLKPCTVLKKLVLISKINYDDDEDEGGGKPTKESEMDNPKVRNIPDLPDSVDILKIQHLKVNKDEVDFILIGKSKPLKQVEFYDCGNERDFGIGLKTIVMVYEQKRIDKFSFVYSLNRKSLQDSSLPSSGVLLAFVLRGGYSVTDFEVQGQLIGQTYEPITEEMEDLMQLAHQSVFDFNEHFQKGCEDFEAFGEVTGDESDNSEDYETLSESTESSDDSSSDSDTD